MRDPIYAKTIVVEQDGARAAFVVLDLVRDHASGRRRGAEVDRGTVRVPGDRVMISATHTHTGPQLPRGSLMDEITQAESPPGLAYVSSLPQLIARSVSEAIAKLTPAKAVGDGRQGGRHQLQPPRARPGRQSASGSRRRSIPPSERPAGPIDPDLGLLVFESLDARPSPVAAYVNFAMHPTSVGGGRAHLGGLSRRALPPAS